MPYKFPPAASDHTAIEKALEDAMLNAEFSDQLANYAIERLRRFSIAPDQIVGIRNNINALWANTLGASVIGLILDKCDNQTHRHYSKIPLPVSGHYGDSLISHRHSEVKKLAGQIVETAYSRETYKKIVQVKTVSVTNFLEYSFTVDGTSLSNAERFQEVTARIQATMV